jgi:phospholipase/carboxylesterase
MRAWLLALALLLLPTRVGAQAELIELGDGAFAYVPANTSGAPAPLLVLLHGNGDSARGMIASFRPHAERRGIVLLAPRPYARTWDTIYQVTGGTRRSNNRGRAGASIDPPRIQAALEALAARTPIDRGRIGLAGFSDGASYALSLGLLNPDLFPAVLVFSPGMAFLPREARPGQRLFLAHGRGDSILPFRVSAQLEPQLRERGLIVAFRRFEGDHVLLDPIVGEGVDWFMDGEEGAAIQ